MQKGKAADLLVVRRNPLEDITALAEPEQVYKSGVPVLARTAVSDITAVSREDLSSLDAAVLQLMRQQGVPGLAVAITDGSGTLWSKGYGHTDFSRGRAVDQDTIFAVLPGSGAITATAVLMACRDGLVDLDTPIASYLPGFRINSVFQEHPERVLTLRQLLNGTAGLAEEAAYGNNNDLSAIDFSKHLESICETWLRFPVGANWAYSNLGLDLAAVVLQERSGVPFPQYVEKEVFAPLGMRRATFDPNSILADTNRAIGHQPFQRKVPPIVPMMGAGGAYASASDLARLVRFHLGMGSLGGQRLVDEKWLQPMYALDRAAGSAGLGIFKGFLTLPGHNRTFGYGTSGGGFGFLSAMMWYPRLGIGGVVLSNSASGSVAWEVLNRVLDTVIDDPRTVFHDRLAAVPENDPESRLPQGDPEAALTTDNRLRLSAIAGKAPPEMGKAWSVYEGDYRYLTWGQAAGELKVRRSGNALTLDGQPLYETSAGLFFTEEGETLDFRGPSPRWHNLEIDRVFTPRWQLILAGAGAAAFCMTMLSAPTTAILGRWGKRAVARSTGLSAAGARSAGLSAAATAAAVLFGLTSAALAVALSKFPYFVGQGMPSWTRGVPLGTGLLTVSPDLALLLAGAMAVCSAISWRRDSWSKPLRIQYSIMTGGAALIVAALAACRLLGIA